MAAKKPFTPFEKSRKDKEFPGFGKEGSKKEEAFDRKQMKQGKPTFGKKPVKK